MAEPLSDDDETDSIDSAVPTYREEATDDDGDAVTLFQAIILHDHTTESKQTGIPIEVKNVMIELFQNGYTTPKAILSEPDKLKIIQPKASQISSFLVTLRKKLYSPAQISLNYIKNWCIEKSIIPNDPDECFVANYYIKDDDTDPLFRLFVTTKNLQ
ncbi:unnamed protein product [Rotaria sp. Silwood1]|nr:unnamed protein product [Rotaria sp. Silwood1]CAF1648208.1 unnamed protein product [Rotaria sp. Silwood1]